MNHSFAKAHNVKPRAKFLYNYESDFEFIKPTELKAIDPEAVYTVRAMYISDTGLYGDAPVVCIDGYRINAPSHMVKKVEEILNCHRSVDLINEGKVGVTFFMYENKYGEQIGLKWTDLKTPDPLPTPEPTEE